MTPWPSGSAFNAKSEAVQAEFERRETLKATLSGLKSMEEFQQMTDSMRKGNAPTTDKTLLAEEAKKRGYGINKEGKVFAQPGAAA